MGWLTLTSDGLLTRRMIKFRKPQSAKAVQLRLTQPPLQRIDRYCIVSGLRSINGTFCSRERRRRKGKSVLRSSDAASVAERYRLQLPRT